MEFGGFIGGFGKNFFTKRGIKREKEGFLEEERKEKRGKSRGNFGLGMERDDIYYI